jgi:hypothetical protein
MDSEEAGWWATWADTEGTRCPPEEATHVLCDTCGEEFVAVNMYVDGRRPGIHWVKLVPTGSTGKWPQCPGWNRAGVPVRRS